LAETGGAVGQVTSDSLVAPVLSVSRQTRLFGLSVLLAASFAPSLMNSTVDFFAPHSYASTSELGYLRLLLKQVTCLALLVYVLNRNGQTTRDIGFRLSPTDLVHAGLLIVAGWFAFQLPRSFAISIYRLTGHEPSPYLSSLAGARLVVPTLLAVVNPFFEELIVRAFLISEVVLLTGSIVLAVVISTLLQTSYHFYQGIPNAIGHGFVFLMFSFYYVKKRRVWPIILAHMYADVHALVYYSQHAR